MFCTLCVLGWYVWPGAMPKLKVLLMSAMMPATENMITMPTVPQIICCFPVSVLPPWLRAIINSTRPQTKKKKPAAARMRRIGLMTYVVNLPTTSPTDINQCATMRSLVAVGIDLNALRNDRRGRGDAEGRLQQAHQTPDRNHDENRDHAVEHHLDVLLLFFGVA